MSSLFCLVYGEPFGRGFKVQIEKGKDVSDLRKLIVNEDPNYFRGISARSLDLWKVNIPITDDKTPQNPDLSNAIELGIADTIADYFDGPLERKHIHIIVKPPPP